MALGALIASPIVRPAEAAGSISLGQFVTKYQGQSVPDPNGGYVGQCLSLIKRYQVEVLGGANFSTPNGIASDMWNAFSTISALPPVYFQVDPAQPAMRGDIAVWGNSATGGHVAIVLADTPASSSTLSVFDQNPETAGQRTRTKTGPGTLLGYLRPKISYTGHIVQWDGDTKAQKTAWLVGLDGRRHWIPSTTDYWCLVNGGVPGPYLLPSSVLTSIVPDDPGSQAPCGGDLNGDGIVNFLDLSLLASEYGTAGHQADINLDGKVSISDLSILAAQWGKKPAPIGITSPLAAVPLAAKASGAALSTRLARPTRANGVGGLAGNDLSVGPSISSDGSVVVFSSLASNLVAGDTNEVLDVFAWNRPAGTVTRVSVDAGGSQLTTPSADATISPNGRYVAFDSGGDVYVKDLLTGALERITQPNGDPAGEPDQAAYANHVTSSGLVVFESKASNLVPGDTNGTSDVYVRQLQAGPVEQVSVASDDAGGVEGNADSYAGAVSDDGRYVVFVSRATNLAAGNTDGQAEVFVRDLAVGTTTLVSEPSAGGQADGDAGFPSISADGQLVAFNSSATNLVAGNPHGYQQVYVRNLATSALRRVSQANDGSAGNSDSTEPALSADGSRVAFRSQATNLVGSDTNYADDIFVQDLSRHLISRVSVTPGLAQANSSSFGPSLSGDGSVVAFSSYANNLTGARAGTSEQIVARAITQLPLSGATPTITGTVKVGGKLTAHTGTWGPSAVTFRYQWYASGVSISGATAPTLNLTAAQYARQITVKVTASLAGYATAAATSKPTAKVAAGTLTAATPTISGTVRAGYTLTANPGTWKPSGVSLKYQWYVNGAAISGATGRTLKLSGTWAGKTITVAVTGSKPGYASSTRSSKPTGRVSP
jgi:hypothetical protein